VGPASGGAWAEPSGGAWAEPSGAESGRVWLSAARWAPASAPAWLSDCRRDRGPAASG
jgi:hypothetical protein